MRYLTIILLGSIWIGPAYAQGWVEPRPGHLLDFGVRRERSVVSVRVEGRLAYVEVQEWFRNDGVGLGEGDYIYPLSGEASFQSFSLFQGDEELRGETMDADRARRIYEEIVRQRRDPALIEMTGNGMIRARIFPINAGETRKITLRYTQLLSRDGEALQFRYVVGRESDATPTVRQSRAPVSLSLTADASMFNDAFSPTHQLEVLRSDERMRVSLADLRGNLSLFLPFSSNQVGVTFATHRDGGEAGYFMLTLIPGELQTQPLPRDVTVVLDVSGSMSGNKIDQARAAIVQLLESLRESDRFRLIAFSNGIRNYAADWTVATTRNVRQARGWVERLSADGGTNISGALERAFAHESTAGRLPLVIFLTDGLPTAGEQNPQHIVDMVAQTRGSRRVFGFGVGYDVNTFLLDELGTAGRGATHYVQPGESIEQAIGALTRKISHPVMADLRIAGSPVELFDFYPMELPDLFSGEELILFGRYREAGNGQLRIEGQRDGHTEEFGLAAELPREQTANAYIPRLWAARKLAWMAAQLRRAPSDELREEIRRLALRYGLLSEFTSYLVEEPVEQFAARPTAPILRQQGASGMSPMGSASMTSGQGAVQTAADRALMRRANTMEELDDLVREREERNRGGRTDIRTVFGRTFRLSGGMWVDVARDTARPAVRVAPYSDAYFALMIGLPELRNFVAAFESVL
ncbi:MAG: VIT domain-containing protein, partial [Gemmatimonadales bacterium]